MAYIYKIINDINQKIYIGKTEFSIEKRWNEHCKDYNKLKNEKRPLYSAMKKYGIQHFRIELIEETTNPEEREIYWIKTLKTFHNGYNATLGGDGKRYINYNLVCQTYRQVQNQTKVAQMLNISIDHVGNILKLMNEPILNSIEVSKNQFSKAVSMYNLQNEYIRDFSSLLDAGRYLINNGLSHCKLTTIRTHISEVCRGKRKSAAGYHWQFK